MNHILEVVMFKAADGVAENDLNAALSMLQTKVEQFAGYQKRTVYRDPNGQYIDLVWWDSLAQAEHAAAEVMKDADVAAFMQLVDPNTINMLHLEAVQLVVAE